MLTRRHIERSGFTVLYTTHSYAIDLNFYGMEKAGYRFLAMYYQLRRCSARGSNASRGPLGWRDFFA